MLDHRVGGSVTVRGRVTRDGRVTDVQVVDATGASVDDRTRLERAAVQNLRAWWLEPASGDDAIRITFSYVIDTSAARRGRTDVLFALPGQVTIRTGVGPAPIP